MLPGPDSCRAIEKAIAGSTSYFWTESYGNIYPVLKKLLAEGALRAEKQAAAGGWAKQSYSAHVAC